MTSGSADLTAATDSGTATSSAASTADSSASAEYVRAEFDLGLGSSIKSRGRLTCPYPPPKVGRPDGKGSSVSRWFLTKSTAGWSMPEKWLYRRGVRDNERARLRAEMDNDCDRLRANERKNGQMRFQVNELNLKNRGPLK